MTRGQAPQLKRPEIEVRSFQWRPKIEKCKILQKHMLE